MSGGRDCEKVTIVSGVRKCGMEGKGRFLYGGGVWALGKGRSLMYFRVLDGKTMVDGEG